MKPGYVLSSEAISNIDEICSFIADDNEVAAVRVSRRSSTRSNGWRKDLVLGTHATT